VLFVETRDAVEVRLVDGLMVEDDLIGRKLLIERTGGEDVQLPNFD
jgi:hypothetical protein